MMMGEVLSQQSWLWSLAWQSTAVLAVRMRPKARPKVAPRAVVPVVRQVNRRSIWLRLLRSWGSQSRS